MEWLAAYCRISAVLWSLVAWGAMLGLVWWPGWQTALTAALVVAWVVAHAWAGFVWLANPEWKDPPDADR